MRVWTIAAVLLIGSVGIASSQDVAAGEKSFRKCLPCHSIGPDAKNKVGPEQNGLDGRKAGTVNGYTYSDANKNSGIVWSEQSFKDYIADPRAKIPGTNVRGSLSAKELGAPNVLVLKPAALKNVPTE